MTDDDAFLRLILDAPDDDGPRLLYADWLGEHGDPDRAEFIRIQCASPPCRSMTTPRHLPRARELLWRWHVTLGRPRCTASSPPAKFRRGLPSSSAPMPGPFLESADRLFAAPRSATSRCRELYGHLPRLVRCPALGPPRALNRLRQPPWATPFAAPLAACPHLSGLAELHLGRTASTTPAVQHLARSPHLGGLSVLDSPTTRLRPGARALAARRCWPGDHSRPEAATAVGLAGAEALIASDRLTKLTTLKLADNRSARRSCTTWPIWPG